MKSRDIPVNDLFSNLQLEWISYYLREKIYNRESDKQKFRDICRMKKEKIDAFERRNCIPSIFSSKPKMKKYITEKFLNQNGLPNFQYTPQNQESLYFWDCIHFFPRDIEIVIDGTVFKVVNNTPTKKQIEVRKEGELVIYYYSDAVRDVLSFFESYL